MGKTRETVVNGVTLNVPQELAGILPVGSSRNFDFEVHSHLGLKHSLREGDTALDVGSSYGVMSALMGKIVGSSGKVYSLEANRKVTAMAELLLKSNGTYPDVRNVAVSDKSGEVEFHAVPGRQSVASTINPEILKVHPDSVPSKVKAVTIDGFCAEREIVPRCVKIDVEGAECVALRGAQETLKRHRPDLVIETHGIEILGVGGSVAELAGQLESGGYKILDMYAGEQVTADQYVSRYANKMGTMLASARMSDQELDLACRAAREAGAPEGAGQAHEDLDFTGERVVPGKVAIQLYHEHLARYAFAAGMVKGKDVLDMGCGAGYGSQFLSEAGASSVLGIDSSKEAVEYARGRYGGARFDVADAVRFETDRKFDVAVAFELIEHTKDHAEFVDSAKRALKKGGVLIVSTPNREENPPGYSNPFHEKEMDEAEFRALLEKRFEHVHLLYQSFVFGVAISGDGDGRISRALEPGPMKKKYLVAVCGTQDAPPGAVFPAAFEHGDYFAQIAEDTDVGTLRGLADSGKYGEAYDFARKRSGDGPEWLYLSAFAAHMTGRHREAIPLYGGALEQGFDAFWVHYNRGQALLSMGEAERGKKDLEAARALDPANKDCKKLLDGLSG